VGVCEACFGY